MEVQRSGSSRVEASAKSFTRNSVNLTSAGGKWTYADDITAAHKVAGIDRADISHQPFYSEENVYLLAETLLEYEQAKSLDELSIVYISNTTKRVLFWSMADARIQDQGLMAREYHCILVQTPPCEPGVSEEDRPSYVWDLDCTLPFPCRLGFYAAHCLRAMATQQYDSKFARYYRVLPAASYLDHFASDRTHMRASDGSWIHQPPPWDPITAPDGRVSTIARFWDLFPPEKHWTQQDAASPYGVVMDEEDFLRRFNVRLQQ